MKKSKPISGKGSFPGASLQTWDFKSFSEFEVKKYDHRLAKVSQKQIIYMFMNYIIDCKEQVRLCKSNALRLAPVRV